MFNENESNRLSTVFVFAAFTLRGIAFAGPHNYLDTNKPQLLLPSFHMNNPLIPTPPRCHLGDCKEILPLLVPHRSSSSFRYSWAQGWACPKCRAETCYCTLCKRFLKGAVADHNRIDTRKRKQEVTAASATTGKRGSSPTGVIHVGEASSSLLIPRDLSAGQRKAIDDVIKASFVREAATQFFQRSFRNENMRSYIVARACFGLGNSLYTHIDKDEVDMHLSTALLCVQVTRLQREILARTVQLTWQVFKKDSCWWRKTSIHGQVGK